MVAFFEKSGGHCATTFLHFHDGWGSSVLRFDDWVGRARHDAAETADLDLRWSILAAKPIARGGIFSARFVAFTEPFDSDVAVFAP